MAERRQNQHQVRRPSTRGWEKVGRRFNFQSAEIDIRSSDGSLGQWL